MHVVYWGTYDVGRSRNRILLRGLRLNGVEVVECNADIWVGVRDKSEVVGRWAGFRVAARLLASYPGLIRRYLNIPNHSIVLVGYLGHLDVVVIWPFAKIRGAKIIWNAYISLYDTMVEDRRMFSRWSLLAWGLSAWEWLCCRAADLILLDTRAHASYFRERYGGKSSRFASVMVGVEPEVFHRVAPTADGSASIGTTHVLHYGQMIPLHGLEFIVKAAALAKDNDIQWTIIGRGQEEAGVREQVEASTLGRVELIAWVTREELVRRIQEADICLGIFGVSEKAARVIPNKVFEALAIGKPIVTMDSPGIRELLSPDMPGVKLVRAGDPQAIYEGVVELGEQRATLAHSELYLDVLDFIFPKAIGAELLRAMRQLIPGERNGREQANFAEDQP